MSTSAPNDPQLYGTDPAARLVDIQLLTPPFSDGPARMRRYWRQPDTGDIATDDVPFFPFFFLSDVQLLDGFGRSRFQFQRLEGDNFYQHLVVFRSLRMYWDAIDHLRRVTDTQRNIPADVYTVGDPVQQYLTQTGQTCFKGMAFEDIHRLQLDIEVYNAAGFPDAQRPDDRIIIIALSDNRGWSQLIEGTSLSEAEMLQAFLDVIRTRDPDVLEGHNLYQFDLPYLQQRCAMHGIPFTLGRDGSEPRTFATSIRFAERTIDYEAYDIAGRHIIDTYFQVMSYDVFKRDLPSYGLKAAAQYFGFAAKDRTYVAGDAIAQVWRENPDRLLAYALDDVFETRSLAEHLSGSAFYLTQMVPMRYGAVARKGPAAKIEALFVRAYLHDRYALPKSEWGTQQMGGFTKVYLTGIAGPIVYADIESLYPSIMLNYDVRPGRDTLGIFPHLLQRLTDLRFATKKAMRDATEPMIKSELDARQSSYKNLINSFYGNLGFSLALFNDFGEADRVASTGQEILHTLIRSIEEAGGRVVEVDTDGVLFIPPKSARGDSEERAFVDSLNAQMPEGIRIGFDGRFAKMLSYKAKNYALLRYDGSLKLKGSSLVSRSTERFGRQFVKDAIRLLLAEDIQGLHDLYLRTRQHIIDHDWTSVDEFARRESLRDTLAQYEADVEAGRRTRSASYELARQRQKNQGVPAQKGDQIRYYLTGSGANVTAFEVARLADDWSSEAPDENTAYYLRRLDEFSRKFEPFFEPPDFQQIFSPEDLFGFDASSIRPIQTEHERPEDANNEPLPF